jgi:hypothetical protein
MDQLNLLISLHVVLCTADPKQLDKTAMIKSKHVALCGWLLCGLHFCFSEKLPTSKTFKSPKH